MSVDELVSEPPERWPRWPLLVLPLLLLPVPAPSALPVSRPPRAILPAAGRLPFSTVYWVSGGVVHRAPAAGGAATVVPFPVAVDPERSFVVAGRVVAVGVDGRAYLDGRSLGRRVPVRSEERGTFWLADGSSVVSVDAATGAYGRRFAVAGVPVAVVGSRAVTGVLAASRAWTVGLDGVAVDRRGRRREVTRPLAVEGEGLVFSRDGQLRALDARARARLVFGSDGSDGRVAFAGRYAVFTVPESGGLAVRAHRLGEATFSLRLRLPSGAVLVGVG